MSDKEINKLVEIITELEAKKENQDNVDDIEPKE